MERKTMSTNTPTAQETTDAQLPRITHHTEPPEQGGERYARCTGCGRESCLGADSILHEDDCPRSQR